ncbi:unnamed protein product [Heligmosomoides polygyrus]|uniref:40S ribosomal protein S26 n=1 Tax=Heligmosomoides polygyrus TaxID=6339 RepID=A0A183GLT6_HELPZ|nr:unnamed protein product [Heligmosomoides polygyrus]
MPRKRRGRRRIYLYDEESGLLQEIVKLTAPPGKQKAVDRYEKPSPVPIPASDWNSVNRTYCVVCRMVSEDEYQSEQMKRSLCRRKATTVLDVYANLSSFLRHYNARQHLQFDLPPWIRIDCLFPFKGLSQPRQVIIDEPCTVCGSAPGLGRFLGMTALNNHKEPYIIF